MMKKNEIEKICNDKQRCVWLMTSTPEPIRTIFTATRTCYSPNDQVYLAYDEWFKYVNKEAKDFPNDAIRLLSKIASMKHLSVLEHVSFTFGVKGVSRSLLAQLTRHRAGWSYSVQSQRYVSFDSEKKDGFDFIIPASIKSNKIARAEFNQRMKDIQHSYNVMVQNGVPAEDARYILPNAAITNATVTCNLRSLLDFYQKRSIKAAQWEIRELAEDFKTAVLKEVPDMQYIFDAVIEKEE